MARVREDVFDRADQCRERVRASDQDPVRPVGDVDRAEQRDLDAACDIAGA
jgi:hypothetical protein